MKYHYHTIFSLVSDKLVELYNIEDKSTNEMYMSIIKNLGPGNDYTFQQIMMEYLMEFQFKNLFFYNKIKMGFNGFHVNKLNDVLEVVEVNEDHRLVVGDLITKMSQDEIKVLEARYIKLLFHEDDAQQDWTHILSKQSQMTVQRGEELYEFECRQYEQLPDNTVKRYKDFQVVTIYNFDETIDYNNDLSVILDLRYARGIQNQTYHADIILTSRLTKGSPEYFASNSNSLIIGEKTYGAANKFETLEFDSFVFVYGTEKEDGVVPDILVENYATKDAMMDLARQKILSLK